MNKNRYRIKFTKTGNIKFIGHLDLLNVFQRTIKRANLPISYSKGFNPHQIMSFAIPLPLGMESICEYIDMELEKDLDEIFIKESLNDKMPLGMEVLNVIKLKEGDKSAPSIVFIGEYEVEFNEKIDETFDKKIEEYLNQDEIIVQRVGKKSGRKVIKTVDIKEDIFSIKAIGENKINLLISTGSMRNLKADSLIESISNFLELGYESHKIKYKRINLFDENKLCLDEL